MGEAAPVCPEVAPLVDVTEPVVEPVVEALIDLAPMEPVVDVAPIVPEAPTTAPPPVPAESDDDDDDNDDDDDGRSLRLGARNPLGDAVGRGRRCRLHVLVRCARRTPSVRHRYAICRCGKRKSRRSTLRRENCRGFDFFFLSSYFCIVIFNFSLVYIEYIRTPSLLSFVHAAYYSRAQIRHCLDCQN